MDVPVMVEEALAAGIDHQYTGPWEYFVGGGAAAFDCNGDRLPDLAVAGGTSKASLYVNRSTIGGELRFEEKPDALPDDTRDRVTGLYPLDIDNDGHRDLVVLRVGENIILKGGPDCSFTEANRAFAFNGGRAWTTAFAATFEPHLPFPTLAFGNYVDRSAPGSPWGTCHDNELLRPIGGGERPNYSEPNVADARLLRALHAVHRLEPLRRAGRCASPMTGNTIARARNSSGAFRRTGRRAPTAAPTAGGACKSGAWASPRPI
jgi:hypothetical protein